MESPVLRAIDGIYMQALLIRGISMEHQGHLESALDDFERAQALDTSNLTIKKLLTEIKIKLGQKQKR